MSTSGRQLKRFLLEYEIIQSGNYPSLQDIQTFLKTYDYLTSLRTIQRDFEKFRLDFGIEIVYDSAQKGYYIDKNASVNLNSFERFLEILNTAELLKDSLKDVKNVFKFVSFDDGHTVLKGIENLKLLFQAVKEHRPIKFDHYNFKTEKYKSYNIKPYLLKEYNNRWYVVGVIGNNPFFNTFGIDRIENLEVKSKHFEPDKKMDPLAKFASAIGVYLPKELQPEFIELSFTPLQGKYVKTLPLHHSQKILIDNDKELRIRLFVVPNYELKQLIISHFDTVKVLKPKHLTQAIEEYAKKIVEKYR